MGNNEHFGVIGASGFVGKAFTQNLLNRNEYQSLSLLTRDRNNPALSEFKNNDKIQIEETDHLDLDTLRSSLENVTQIFDTAGLAWQHPGEKGLSKYDLMIEEIVQNALSAFVLTRATRPDQIVVWTSTNAIDYMLARLVPEDLESLKAEIERITEEICSTINLENTRLSDFQNTVSAILRRNQPGLYPKMIGSFERVQFALEFSYAYSKYLGQTILNHLSQGNIRVLKISDVYGPGQDVSEKMINPTIPARRLQRFMAAYSLIKSGMIDWIPQDGSNLHGFSRRNDVITQEVWNDFVFPTHVNDVSEMMLRSSRINSLPKTILNVSGHKVTNPKMASIVRDAFEVDVEIKTQKGSTIDVKESSEDLPLLGMNSNELTSLETGVSQWVNTL